MAAASEAEIPSSPAKKNKSVQVIHENQKLVVLNNYKSLKEENPQMSYFETMRQLSRMTGIGKNSIKKIIVEYSRTSHLSEPIVQKPRLSVTDKIDEFDKNETRRKVHDFYRNREMPTIDRVLQAVNDDEDLPELKRSTFHKLLLELNFTFRKRQRNSALTERED